MASGDYVVERTSTEVVSPHERADYWGELLSSYHRKMGYSYAYRDGFGATATRQRTGRYQLVEWQQNQAVWMRRTTRHVREDADEDYRFALPVQGQFSVRQGDDTAQVSTGTGSLFTMDRPFVLGFGVPTRGLVLTIPRAEFDVRMGSSAPVAAELNLGSGLGRVLYDLLVSTVSERDVLRRCQFDALCERLVELMCLLVVGDDRPDAPENLTGVEATVRRYVRAHAGEASLTGESIARALGWSLRHVQRTLQIVGTTPRELIREERLRLAREWLQNPAYREKTITEIAHLCGFSSPSMLSHAFRKRYGVAPRDLR